MLGSTALTFQGDCPAACVLSATAPAPPAAQTSCRLCSVALVSRRFRVLSVAPELLQQLRIQIRGKAAVEPLIAWIAQHASPTRSLVLSFENAEGVADSELQPAIAICLAAAGTAARQLRALDVSDSAPVSDTTWLPTMQQLQKLSLGHQDVKLRIASGITRLSALQSMEVRGSPLIFECAALPASLTRLDILDESSEEVPDQVRRENMPLQRSSCAACLPRALISLPILPCRSCNCPTCGSYDLLIQSTHKTACVGCPS